MANRRMIYQDFFEDDYFGTAEIPLRLFWIGLITAVADDQGRMLDNVALIRAKVFMYDPDISTDQIEGWLSKLHQDNKMVRYQADGKRLIQITKWWEYQTPAWASASKYPAPEGWVDRVRHHISGPTQGGQVETKNWTHKGGFSKQNKELRSKQGSKQGDGIVKLREDNDKLRNKSAAGASLDEKETALVDYFCNATDIDLPIGISTYAKWLQQVGEWVDMGVTESEIDNAIEVANKKNMTIVRPGSLTGFIRVERAQKKNGGHKTDAGYKGPFAHEVDSYEPEIGV